MVGHFVRIWISGTIEHPVHCGQDFFGQIPTQFDVDTTACHIGCYGYRAKGTSASNDLTLFGVFASVQNLVWDTSLKICQ